MFENGTIIANEWRIVDGHLGEGGQGSVFGAVDMNTGRKVVVKVNKTVHGNELSSEARMYNEVLHRTIDSGQEPIVPIMDWYGEVGGHEVMVIDRLGPSLDEIMRWNGWPFSLRTVQLLFLRCLDCLEHLHNCGIVHYDIKPSNMCVGRGVSANKVFLIDLGLSQYEKDPQGNPMAIYGVRGFEATPAYCSTHAHCKGSPCKKDDLESLFYAMLELHNGALPWKMTRRDTFARLCEVARSWKSRPVSELCNYRAGFFARYLEAIREMRFWEKPDYEMLREIIRADPGDGSNDESDCYDWLYRNDGTKIDSSGLEIEELYGEIARQGKVRR